MEVFANVEKLAVEVMVVSNEAIVYTTRRITWCRVEFMVEAKQISKIEKGLAEVVRL